MLKIELTTSQIRYAIGGYHPKSICNAKIKLLTGETTSDHLRPVRCTFSFNGKL